MAPRDWRVGDARFGDVVVRAPIGRAIVAARTDAVGLHGYDARTPEMAAMLVARGRGIASGTRVGRISSLRIAPTVLALLGLPAAEGMREPPITEMLVGVEAVGPGAEPAPATSSGAPQDREEGT